MDARIKQILLKLVADIEDLRATVAALTGHSLLRTSIADAQDAKTQGRRLNQQHYDELRKEIEAL
jgi:hypothetical protein